LVSIALLALPAARFLAQAPQGAPLPTTITRTADGRPDLQGVWVNNSATPLERPKELEGRPFLTDEEVRVLQERADRLFKDGASDHPGADEVFRAALENRAEFKSPNATQSSIYDVDRVFDNQTSLVIDPPDGKVPALTAEGRRRVAATAAARLRRDGPEDFTPFQRCITWGLPRINAGNAYSSYYHIVQTKDYIVFDMETDVRIVPIDGGRPHLPASIKLWLGDSHARWDGDTLIIDTTNFRERSDFRESSDHLHLVEKLRRQSAKVLDYQITIDDPTVWVSPWTVSLRLAATTDRLYEYACQEGNFQTMSGMLAAARADEKGAAREENK